MLPKISVWVGSLEFWSGDALPHGKCCSEISKWLCWTVSVVRMHLQALTSPYVTVTSSLAGVASCALFPPAVDTMCCSGYFWASVVQALGVHSFCLFTRYMFLIIFATDRVVKPMNSSCLFFCKFLKTDFNVCCSLQKHEARTSCQCSLEAAGLCQQLSSLALLPIMSSLFQSPFQATK